MLREKCGFIRSSEIAFAVTSVDLVEKTEVASNGFCQNAIGRSNKCDPAAAELLLTDQIKNRLPIRKTRGVQVNTGSKLALQECASAKEPHRQQKQRTRSELDKAKNALPQKVAADQSTVEVNAQDGRRFLGNLGSSGGPHGNNRRKGRSEEGEEVNQQGNLSNMHIVAREVTMGRPE